MVVAVLDESERQFDLLEEASFDVEDHAVVAGVELAETRRGEGDYSVDGEVPTVNSRRFNGLFLSLKKREGETSVQTLVVPPGEYQPGKRVQMSVGQSSQRIGFGRVLEQHPDWVWATVEPLPAATQAPAASP